MVNTFYVLQIVLGAAVTALGAARGPPGAVTFFGAVGTIVAGLLTYLKGQGLPARLEQYLHQLRTLREHIETREREFLEPECPLNVDEEIASVTKMYQEVRQTAQDNAPGNLLQPRGAITSLLKKPDINRADVPYPGGDKPADKALTNGLPEVATGKHDSEDSASAAEKGESPWGNAKGGMKGIESEIERLRGVANDTINNLNGEYVPARHLQQKVDPQDHRQS